MEVLDIFTVKYLEADSLITVPPLSFSEALQASLEPIFLPKQLLLNSQVSWLNTAGCLEAPTSLANPDHSLNSDV